MIKQRAIYDTAGHSSSLGVVIELNDLTERIEGLERRVVELEQRLSALVTPAAVPFTVKELSRKHPTYSEGSLRWLLFLRHTNGLERAVIQGRGGRLKIDEQAFLEWVAEGREAAPVPVPRGRAGREREAIDARSPAARRRRRTQAS